MDGRLFSVRRQLISQTFVRCFLLEGPLTRRTFGRRFAQFGDEVRRGSSAGALNNDENGIFRRVRFKSLDFADEAPYLKAMEIFRFRPF